MPSSQKFRDYVVGQFKGELRVTTRKMMGEYILYADGKIFGGIYDDRLLVKPVAAAKAMLPDAKLQLPYDGAKPMLRVTAEQIADKGASMMNKLRMARFLQNFWMRCSPKFPPRRRSKTKNEAACAICLFDGVRLFFAVLHER